MKTVLVVQRRLTKYRVPFFEALRSEMAGRGIDFRLAYGSATPLEALREDSAELSWAEKLKTTYLLGGRICIQSFRKAARGCDLVVLTHENKLINNLFEQFGPNRRRLILWGHGAHLQRRKQNWLDRFKKVTSRKADWWLAYTEMSVPLIRLGGFPAERITVLNNAVDTYQFDRELASVTEAEIQEFRREVGVSGRHLGIFVGSLHTDKRIEFLLNSALEIKRRIPDFELLVVGDGPLRHLVEEFQLRNAWVHFLGARVGREKAIALQCSVVMLNPGLVGLGILDAFVAAVPMVTTDCGLHSPEISYLSSHKNGVMTQNGMAEFVGGVVKILEDSSYLRHLRTGCIESATNLTVENMAKNFADGVSRCLQSPKYR